jgi:GNAT superfamily N-acetyltransferase
METKSPGSEITIDPENLDRYGFVCFHDPGESLPRQGHWIREIQLEQGLDTNRMQKFVIPVEFLHRLSPDSPPLVSSDYFKVLDNQNDIRSLLILSQRAGWNQTEQDLGFLVRKSGTGNFVAVLHHSGAGVELGTGVTLAVNQSLFWIGMVLVHPEVRRQGIAAAIVKRCIDEAGTAGRNAVIGLDATPHIRNLYKKFGFRDFCTIWRCVLKTDSVMATKNSGKVIKIPEVSRLAAYEAEHGGVARTAVLQQLLQIYPRGCFAAVKAGVVCGYIMSRPGRLLPYIGPLVADDAAVAAELINRVTAHWSACGFDRMFIDTPALHFSDSQHASPEIPEKPDINSTGKHNIIPDLLPVRALIRMYLAAPPETDDKNAMQSKNTGTGIDLLTAREYMEKEKRAFLPHAYAIAGPELG